MIANRWNDSTYSPETEPFPHLHEDFVESVTLHYGLVSIMTKATGQKVKDKFQTLNVALARVICNYQQSGQGDGG